MEEKVLHQLIDLMKSKQSTRDTAHKTAKILVKAIKSQRENLRALVIISVLKNIGRQIWALDPLAFAITNIIKRVISLTRIHSLLELEDNLINHLSRTPSKDTTPPSFFDNYLEYFDALDELLGQFTDVYAELSKYLLPYINNEEVILTWGYSETILQCLILACQGGKKIIVLVANNNLKNDGPAMVQSLVANGIEAYRVEDASLSSVMQKVNKVIFNCYGLMADGGVLGFSGLYALGMIAKEYSVPVVVVTPMYKVTPRYSFGQSTFNKIADPELFFKRGNNQNEEAADVVVPLFDYIPSEYVSLIISQDGEHTTDYVYRLFKDMYSKEEYLLDF
jgi:translation initiation factor eIF-2B subunit beta